VEQKFSGNFIGTGA